MGITAKSVVKTAMDLPGVCRELVQQFRQPVLIEEFLTGREFTVGIVGTGNKARVMGTMEIVVFADKEDVVYSFENKEGWKSKVQYLPLSPEGEPLIGEVEELALSAWKALGCRDGGRIDIRCDGAGRPNFIEVNPLAGLRPEYSDLPIVCQFFGTSYVQLVQMILESALDRVALLEMA
jgi:D-alanine-D-alanine ligase